MIKRWYRQISVVAGVVFLFGIYQYLIQAREINLSGIIGKVGVVKLLFSSLFYLLSHLVRGLRLAVMSGREDISLRKVIRTQYYTNGVNLILPFKLGEVFRLYSFHKLIKKYEVSLSAIVAEKSIDFCFLFVGLILAFYSLGNVGLNLNYTILTCGFFAAVILFVFFVLPQNIKSFNLFLAKRYSYPYIIKVMGACNKIYFIIRNMKQIVHEKITTLLLLTTIIWVFEILGFIYLIDFLPGLKWMPLLAILVFLSVFIPSGSLGLGGIQLGFYCLYIIDNKFPFLELSFIYQIFLFLPAIFISTFIFIADKYEELKSVWIKVPVKYSKKNVNGVVLKESENEQVQVKLITRIQSLYRYFKMKANL